MNQPAAAWSLRTDLPIALLPVRLETRIVTAAAPSLSWRLRVRLYPDEVHIDNHDPELTDTEIRWGTSYWRTVLGPAGAAGDGPARDIPIRPLAGRAEAAWAHLAGRFGPRRARWVAHVTQPRAVRTGIGVHWQWPVLQPRDDDAGRVSQAVGLPTEWHVSGTVRFTYADGTHQRVSFAAPGPAAGDRASRPLPAGPDPRGGLAGRVGGADVPAGMRWMLDFAEAAAEGLAGEVELPEPPARPTDRVIERLLVFGACANATPGEAARALADLLTAHRFSDGFELLPPGTPTNTTQTVLAGGASDGRGPAPVPVAEPNDAPAGEPDANRTRLARALGLPARHLPLGGPLAYTDNSDERTARHLTTALWPATWGYFLWHLMGPTLTTAQVEWARRHFVEFVRAGGPLPAVRIGAQPYGILPVTALRLWDDNDAGVGRGLVALLRQLMLPEQGWPRAAGTVPRLGAEPVWRALPQMLSVAPHSVEWAVRRLYGREYIEYRGRLAGSGGSHQVRETAASPEAARLLRAAGLRGTPRIEQMAFSAEAVTVARSLTGHGTGPADHPLAACLAWLCRLLPGAPPPAGGASWAEEMPWEDLRTERGLRPGAGPWHPPLLYRLLRHGALVALAMAVSRRPEARLLPTQRRERYHLGGEEHDPELVNIRPDEPGGGPTRTLWWLLGQPADDGGTVAEQIWTAVPDDLLRLRDSLLAIAEMPDPVLERAAAQTLDLASYRLDAWVTSFATRRLAELPGPAAEGGIHLGAYGWVEDLRPAGDDGGNGAGPGYLAAPSQSQAITAAVLQAAHLSAAAAGEPATVAVDLPSRRLRTALWLLDGVRQGQPFGALLGYRLERRLRESGRGEFIPAFRTLAAIRGLVLAAGEPVSSTTADAAVTDGLDLHRRWCTTCGTRTLAVPGPPGDAGIVAALDELHDLVDAVGDALLTESVHQVLTGSPQRANAVAAVLDGQGIPPDRMDVFRTPRTGVAVTHRLVLLTDRPWPVADSWPPGGPAAGPPDSAWVRWPAPDEYQARAFAEPTLNALAADLLPAPCDVRCRLTWTGGNTDTDRPEAVALDMLPLSPLDHLYLAAEPSAGDPVHGELARRLRDALHRLYPGAEPTLHFGRDGSADLLGVEEFLEIAHTVAGLLLSARPLRPADLAPGGDSRPTPAVSEVAARADAAVRRLDAALAALSSTATAETGLRMASALGVPDCFPAPGLTDSERHTMAERVQAELADRRRTLPGEDTAPADRDLDTTAARLAAVFGAAGPAQRRFPVLPTFEPTDAERLRHLAAASAGLLGDPHEPRRWLHRAARVTPGVQRLLDTVVYRETLGAAPPGLVVLQVEGPTDHWLGAPPPAAADADSPAMTGGTSIVAAYPAAAPPDALFIRPGPDGSPVPVTIGGLYLDGWTETVPSAQESAAVALRADTPAASAPQAILLAVAPRAGETWTPDLVAHTLDECLDLVRLRAVHPDQLGQLGQYLPAACLAVNPERHTASTDLFEATDA